MILVLNSGSLSEKLALFNEGLELIDSVNVDIHDSKERFECLARFLEKHKNLVPEIHTVGHRFVHGGQLYRETTLVDAEVMNNLSELENLAPLHNPPAIQGLKASTELLKARQVLVFDTAFHATLDPVHYTYPLPAEMRLRRWGFHGISYQWSLARAGELLNRDAHSLNLIACHLGGGASVCAIKDGVSIDTSMGFTPMEGLMMGTRSGSIDPGIILRLVQKHGHREVDHALNKASGLLGIAGSADMRSIEADLGNADALLAHEMYILSVRKYIFAMAANLQKLDALIFTGGIGFHSSKVRAGVCRENLLGLSIDSGLNELSGDRDISKGGPAILCIQANEELMIARACRIKLNQV